MGFLKKLWTFSLEGEKGRAVVRFWKGFLFSLAATIAVPIAGGVAPGKVLEAWPAILATALLAGLGLGAEKMRRAIKEKV